ncbi:MAG TPA: hypothetical protein VJC20_02565 [Candidatus Paceibacterota bacterium]
MNRVAFVLFLAGVGLFIFGLLAPPKYSELLGISWGLILAGLFGFWLFYEDV